MVYSANAIRGKKSVHLISGFLAAVSCANNPASSQTLLKCRYL